MTIDAAAVAAIAAGIHGDPHGVLGIHPVRIDGKPALAVRAFLPAADSAAVLRGTTRREMKRLSGAGLFEAVFPGETRPFAYQLSMVAGKGPAVSFDDPYRFAPVLTDFDLHLFVEGNHFRLYDKLGAHLITHEDVAGVHFAVWAPNARQVALIGSFNGWDDLRHPMRPLGTTGLWEIFIPGLSGGELYKYRIRSRHREVVTTKADPYGFAMERRPETASIVWDLGRYQWQDGGWMESRRARQALDRPISIYEVHLGSWRRRETEAGRWLTYRELAAELVPYARDMGYTHLELLPICEHPFDGSWGYQTVGYFAPTSRFGTPDDFRYFVDCAHQAGLGIILDWVPAHFPKDAHGLAFFDGTHLYEHADPRKGQHQDWGTLIFNFSRPEVSAFLLTNALFWLEVYHLDGLRVDAVASMLYLDYSRKEGEWEPNQFGGRENLEAVEFLKRFNVVLHEKFPDVLTFAEESTSWPMVSRPVYLGGLGFDLKWNMGWMHDMLEYMKHDPLYRRHVHNKLTFSLFYAFTENFLLPLSHDEVVHGKGSLINKMPGDYWRRFANLRAFYAYMAAHPGKKLLFMGSEFGQWKEWNHDAALDWSLLDFDNHRDLKQFVADLNHFYQAEPALYEIDFDWEGFLWIDFRDVDRSVVSFVRRGRAAGEIILVVANFTPLPRPDYRVGVPLAGPYREVMNSDAERYGGSGVANAGPVATTEGEWQGQPFSIAITLPPLAVLFLKPEVRPAGAPSGA